MAVQELYQEDRTGAESYLAYLAKHGFPKPAEPVTQQQVAPVRRLEEQQQAISQYQPDAYGQIANGQTDADRSNIAFYSGNLIAELVANSAYSAVVFGERRSGISAVLRGIAYDQIAKSGHAILDILDLHNGEWGGLEDIKLPDGSQIVNYPALSTQADIAAIASKLAAIANEVRRRQQQQREQSRFTVGK